MTQDEMLDDLTERIRKAKDTLYEEYEKQVNHGSNVCAEERLLGKIDGLALAQDYLRAYRQPAR